MPEFVRRTVSENYPRVLCPALEEGAELPPGLTPEQRLCLTQGRLAADYVANLLIEKQGIAKGYGMSISLIAEEQPMKMIEQAPSSEGFFATLKAKASNVIEKVKNLWKI